MENKTEKEVNDEIIRLDDLLKKTNFELYSIMNKKFINRYYREIVSLSSMKCEHITLSKVLGLNERGYLVKYEIRFDKQKKEVYITTYSIDITLDENDIEEITEEEFNTSFKAIIDEVKQLVN